MKWHLLFIAVLTCAGAASGPAAAVALFVLALVAVLAVEHVERSAGRRR